ncbi:hypothetical protein RND81_03G060600 [Saponaria officinalis]|uniref:Uncharacterized protein n=1 Tax=Saponaria officinalis TaxID=3572 RepID=A0AAW1M5B2_SAPOF
MARGRGWPPKGRPPGGSSSSAGPIGATLLPINDVPAKTLEGIRPSILLNDFIFDALHQSSSASPIVVDAINDPITPAPVINSALIPQIMDTIIPTPAAISVPAPVLVDTILVNTNIPAPTHVSVPAPVLVNPILVNSGVISGNAPQSAATKVPDPISVPTHEDVVVSEVVKTGPLWRDVVNPSRGQEGM